MLTPEGVQTGFAPQGFAALTEADFAQLLEQRPEIVLLGTDWHRSLLDGRPGPVDRVVPVPPTQGEVDSGPEDPAAVEAFAAGMRAEGFDLAVQMHGGGRWSNPLTARLGARCTVGLRAPDAPPLDRTLPYSWYQSELLRYLELVGLVGAPPVTLHPRLATARSRPR